ncbi:hypothetical protein QYE76_039740 [Lolium multiflorum]|uniref:Aminotransferase-like plant mobile domain-containing protein n=1 Tax=Lolium multiflorum TaxID=4521 RepID=A0AAD8TBP4_LOLMU|nr:hypothetical protein QYE76_039740 [Lolium multiflorum]
MLVHRRNYQEPINRSQDADHLDLVLEPLKIRYHGSMKDMPYDKRYTEFIQPTDLLSFITLVSRGPPNMNAAKLTVLVDRWRPDTHTFHLRAGEMTPTLQDVSMILGLPIHGEALCMNTTSDGWRQQMEGIIGMAPSEPANKKDRANGTKRVLALFAIATNSVPLYCPVKKSKRDFTVSCTDLMLMVGSDDISAESLYAMNSDVS